jgi:hypothetical protein
MLGEHFSDGILQGEKNPTKMKEKFTIYPAAGNNSEGTKSTCRYKLDHHHEFSHLEMKSCRFGH